MAVLTVAALTCSCKKDPQPKPGPDDNPDEGGEVAENIITIDGEFDDWKALANVAVAEVPDDETGYPCLIKMKAVADKTNVYLYFEYVPADEQTKAPITIEFDSDYDESTGFSDFHWASVGWDYALESSAGFLGTNAYMKINDFSLIIPKAGFDGQARAWDAGQNWTSGSAKGVKNRGKVTNGVYCFEINVPRTLLKAEKKGTLSVGTYVEDQNWSETGILPIDDGMGMSEFLDVVLP